MAVGDWAFCDCCSEDCADASFQDGGDNECSVGRFHQQAVGATFVPPADPPTHPCDPFNCTIGYFSACFPTEDIAEDFVGAGNFDPVTFATDDWLLFFTPDGGGDGAGTFARDSSRPVALEIDVEPFTFAHPTFGFSNRRWLVPVEVRLAATWTWNRVSTDPTSDDFKKWELTAGTPPDGTATECIGMKLRFFNAGLVWVPDSIPSLIAEFDADEAGDTCCPALDIDPCLVYRGQATEVDGWNVGGLWDADIGTDEVETICTGGAEGALVASVSFHGSEIGGFNIDNQCRVATVDHSIICGELPSICQSSTQWGLACVDRDDVKALPDAADFTEVISNTANCDDHTFDSLTEGDCDETDGVDNCPPDECPLAYCKFAWNLETEEWDLVFSNCVSPAECPPTPTDPPGPGDPLVICLCCVTPDPECGPGSSPCLGETCSWTWNAMAGVWGASPCQTINCSCDGAPEDAGLFDGEVRAGICCQLDDP